MSIQLRRYPLWINGQSIGPTDESPYISIQAPHTGEIVARAGLANESQLALAIEAAYRLRRVMKETSLHARAEVLLAISHQITSSFAEALENVIVEEAGKPRSLARAEVQRAGVTFRLASEEARRWRGSLLALEGEQAAVGFSEAELRRVPRGVVFAISPFNFPLNLAAHKVAPAIAVGAPVLLKPPHQAPGACDLLMQIWEGVVKDWNARFPSDPIPLAALQTFQAPPALLEKVVQDERIAVVSFTGSDRVGWRLKSLAPKKQVLLELGGNASVIVHSDADLELALARCVYGAFAYAGQICISVQKIWVHSSLYNDFKVKLKSRIESIQPAEPGDSRAMMGPLIDASSHRRILTWKEDALSKGATLFVEGSLPDELSGRDRYLSPFVLENVPKGTFFDCDELFGPGVAISSYESIDELLIQLNESRFGLQGGVFTNDPVVVRTLFENWEVGGLIVNEVPTWRVDSLPYGGTKDSGTGREGPKYAMEDYSELRVKVEKRRK